MHQPGHFGSSVVTHMKNEITPYVSGRNGILTNPLRFLSITLTLGVVSVISVAAVNGIGAYLKDEL